MQLRRNAVLVGLVVFLGWACITTPPPNDTGDAGSVTLINDASVSVGDAATSQPDSGVIAPDASMQFDASMVGMDAASTLDSAVAVDAAVPPDAAVAPDAGGNVDRIPVFLAMGYGTRRVVSCDLGLTWVNDEVDSANGGDDGFLVRGLTYGDGKFVAAVGGGGVQKLFVSDDGVTWTRQQFNGHGYSDVAYGLGRFVAGGGHVSVLSFDGHSWEQPGEMGSGGILRVMTFGDYGGGRFVAAGDQGRRMNSVDGVHWASEISSGGGFQSIAAGNGLFIALRGDGSFAVSTNGGDSWTERTIPGTTQTRGVLFDGIRFIVTTSGDAFTSTDGLMWQAHSASAGPDSMAVNPERTHYAGAGGGTLYHSTNGTNWTVAPSSGANTESLTGVSFGMVQRSTVCP